MPLSPTRLFAAALVLALGACDLRQREPDTAAKSAPPNDSATAPAPAPPAAAAKPAPDSCDLKRALEVWRDSALAQKRYGDYVAVRLAANEIAPPRPPRVPDAAAAPADSAARAKLCQTAREQRLDPFLTAYRPTAPGTALTPEVVQTLGEITPSIARSTSGLDGTGPAAVDSADGASGSTNPPPEVPREWLAALIALVAVAGAVVGYALWRLGRTVGDAEQRLQESQNRQQTQLGLVRDEIDRTARSLQEEVKNALQATRDEVKNCFGLVRNEVAMLRERVMESRQGDAGAGASAGWPADRGGYGDGGGTPLVLDPDPYGTAPGEETTVDVRPADGGSASIHADGFGVFTVRWARGSDTARLSVDSAKIFSAAHRDKLDAAFQCIGVDRGSGKYRTMHEASCSWDPGTGQGRIIRRGVVEEAG